MNKALVPMRPGTTLPECELEGVQPRYRERVGGLMYLLQTRIDMAFTVGQSSRHCHRNSEKVHGAALKDAFRYLQGKDRHSLFEH